VGSGAIGGLSLVDAILDIMVALEDPLQHQPALGH